MLFLNIKPSSARLKETEITTCLSIQGLGLGAADIQLMFPGGVKEQDSQSVALSSEQLWSIIFKTVFFDMRQRMTATKNRIRFNGARNTVSGLRTDKLSLFSIHLSNRSFKLYQLLVPRLFCIAVTIQDWILAVNLLLSWDDQKTISAAEMEEFLSRFLEVFGLAHLLQTMD